MIYILLLILNIILYFSFSKLSKILNIYDNPDGKLKIHNIKTPLLGGVIFFLNFILISLFQLAFSDDFLMLKKTFFIKEEIMSIIFFITIFFIIGLYDDKNNISPYTKLFIVIIFSIILIFLNKNLIVQNFSLSFYDNQIFLNKFSIFFTIFCIVILTNSLNFYDGINGQSGNIYIIVFSYLYFKSDFNYFYLILILPLIFILVLNLYNKLFFGDSGVYLISSIMIICLIYEHNISKNIIYADEIFFLFLLPGLDLVRLTIARLFLNKNIFYGDRNHFHHYLTKKYDLIVSNLLLISLNLLPITFLSLGINFYYILFSYLIVYFSFLYYLMNSKNEI
jgi:UDP-GlcNAc:undecaprenyl-phosphate GlcNAc-1-phosphate transferase